MQNNNVTQVLILEICIRKMSVFDNDEDHLELGPSDEFDNRVVFFTTQLKTCPKVLNKYKVPSIKKKKEIGLKI